MKRTTDVTEAQVPAHFSERVRGSKYSLERIMREIRRSTRVVGAFAGGQPSVVLEAARLREMAA